MTESPLQFPLHHGIVLKSIYRYDTPLQSMGLQTKVKQWAEYEKRWCAEVQCRYFAFLILHEEED
jgi:hypothetical protein